MSKVIKTIVPEDGMSFEEIMSFKTEDCIGIWNDLTNSFLLMNQSDEYFEPHDLLPDNDCFHSLEELDQAVYKYCGQHITEVFDHSKYTIKLE